MILMFPDFCLAQDKKEYIPDGTMGEQLEVLDSNQVPTKWRDKRWRLFPGRFSTMKFGLGFLYEFSGYSQDAIGKQQTDSIGSPLEPTFSVRDFRLLASGQFKTREPSVGKSE